VVAAVEVADSTAVDLVGRAAAGTAEADATRRADACIMQRSRRQAYGFFLSYFCWE
jgi:hypothetical protein